MQVSLCKSCDLEGTEKENNEIKQGDSKERGDEL